MKYSAFVLLQTWLRDASARPFINLHFCSWIVLSKTSLWKHSAEVSRFRRGSSRPASGLGSGWQDPPLPGRNPADGVQEKLQETNICNMGRGSICAESFLMKYGLLTVQEGRGRAVWEAAYRSTAVQTHSSSAVTDPRWFYCPYILRTVLKSEIWDRWIRTAGRGLEGFIERALVSVTPVNGHHMLAVICASCWICIGCMMWINDFL